MTMEAKIAQLKKEIEQFRGEIQDLIAGADDGNQPLAQIAAAKHAPRMKLDLKLRRALKGHFGKVNCLQWGLDGRHLVSAAQDGTMLVWNAFLNLKDHVIVLRSSWVMTCAYSPSMNVVACGGLDNQCTLYELGVSKKVGPQKSQTVPSAELCQHEGYISSIRFVNDQQAITSSGDATCILWDLTQKRVLNVFKGHAGDVMSVSVSDQQPQTFVSGSCDANAKLWDMRTKGRAVQTFIGHEADINAVDFMPKSPAFATGSDDSTCRLFDVRACRQLNRYGSDKILCGITSISFGRSGRLLFGGYDDFHVYAYDVLHGDCIQDMKVHLNRVSSIGVSPDGRALATTGWDQMINIMA